MILSKSLMLFEDPFCRSLFSWLKIFQESFCTKIRFDDIYCQRLYFYNLCLLNLYNVQLVIVKIFQVSVTSNSVLCNPVY